MKKVVLFSVIFALVLCLIDTAIISHLRFLKFRLDIVLILLVFIASYNGSLVGVVSGFFSGLVLDLLSLAPLGLHSAIFVIIAFVIGKLYGRYNLSRIFVPMLLTVFACLAQAGLLYLLRFIFGNNIAVPNLALIGFWIGFVINVSLAPILFAVFTLFSNLLKVREIL